jgi:hypothetical protein
MLKQYEEAGTYAIMSAINGRFWLSLANATNDRSKQVRTKCSYIGAVVTRLTDKFSAPLLQEDFAQCQLLAKQRAVVFSRGWPPQGLRA